MCFAGMQELEAAHANAAEHRAAKAGWEAQVRDSAQALQAAQDELFEVRRRSSLGWLLASELLPGTMDTPLWYALYHIGVWHAHP